MLVLVTFMFLLRQWRIHRETEVGGEVNRASLLVLVGLVFILVPELMDFLVLTFQMPYFWMELSAVTPQIGGFLFVFAGIIGSSAASRSSDLPPGLSTSSGRARRPA